jgi:hypothetical protein
VRRLPFFLILTLAPALFATNNNTDKKNDWLVEKFDSGKVKSQTHYQGNDLLEAEAFFENGKSKLTTKKAGKAKKGYGPDDYTFKELDEDGHTIGEGTCSGPPLQPLDPYAISKKPKMHYGMVYCKEHTGIRRGYSDKKELITESSYKDGLKDGESTYWIDDTIQKITYQKSVKVKLVETDKKTGKVLKSEEYFSDGSKK